MIKILKSFFRILFSILIFLCLFMGTFNLKQATVSANETATNNLEELLQPVWEGEISYQESVLPVMGEANALLPIKMLYPIKEIIEVKNASQTITYQENVDYILHEGELLILKSGKIPIMMHREFYPAYGQSGFEARGGGYVCFSEGDFFHNRQIVVTYTHEAKYTGYKPENKAHLLKNIHAKLAAKEDIDLLVFGDSISVGGNASGFLNVAPYLPTYSELFAEGLKKTYGVNVNIHNASVGGKDSSWGEQTIDGVLSNLENIDLAIVAFGMNDGGMSGSSFAWNIQSINSKIKAKFVDVDILMIATMLPNYDAIRFYGNQELFHTYLSDLETEGVALVNMTKVHASLLERKRYADMTGNNVNHANDYLSRVYAQTLLETLAEESEEGVDSLEEDKASNSKDWVGKIFSSCTSIVSAFSCVPMLGLALIIQICKKDEKI